MRRACLAMQHSPQSSSDYVAPTPLVDKLGRHAMAKGGGLGAAAAEGPPSLGKHWHWRCRGTTSTSSTAVFSGLRLCAAALDLHLSPTFVFRRASRNVALRDGSALRVDVPPPTSSAPTPSLGDSSALAPSTVRPTRGPVRSSRVHRPLSCSHTGACPMNMVPRRSLMLRCHTTMLCLP